MLNIHKAIQSYHLGIVGIPPAKRAPQLGPSKNPGQQRSPAPASWAPAPKGPSGWRCSSETTGGDGWILIIYYIYVCVYTIWLVIYIIYVYHIYIYVYIYSMEIYMFHDLWELIKTSYSHVLPISTWIGHQHPGQDDPTSRWAAQPRSSRTRYPKWES